MAAALGEVGAGPSVGYCACLRLELSGEPDAGNLHLRFDEGRVGRAIVGRPPSYSTNEGGKKHRQKPEFPLTRAGLLMEDAEEVKKGFSLARSVIQKGCPRRRVMKLCYSDFNQRVRLL